MVARRAAEFRNHGLVRDPARQRFTDEGAWHQEVHEFGQNYRLTDVACALGLSQLKRLDEFKKRWEGNWAQAERLYRELPSSKLDVVHGAGHMLHYSHPERVMQAVTSIAA